MISARPKADTDVLQTRLAPNSIDRLSRIGGRGDRYYDTLARGRVTSISRAVYGDKNISLGKIGRSATVRDPDGRNHEVPRDSFLITVVAG